MVWPMMMSGYCVIAVVLVERLGGSLYIDPHYTKGTSVKFSIAI